MRTNACENRRSLHCIDRPPKTGTLQSLAPPHHHRRARVRADERAARVHRKRVAAIRRATFKRRLEDRDTPRQGNALRWRGQCHEQVRSRPQRDQRGRRAASPARSVLHKPKDTNALPSGGPSLRASFPSWVVRSPSWPARRLSCGNLRSRLSPGRRRRSGISCSQPQAQSGRSSCEIPPAGGGRTDPPEWTKTEATANGARPLLDRRPTPGAYPVTRRASCRAWG